MRLIGLTMVSLLLTSLLLVDVYSYVQNQLTPDRGFIFSQRNNTEPMPDLAFNGIISIYGPNDSIPNDGDECQVRFVILNRGDSIARNVKVIMLVDGYETDNTTIPVLKPKENISINFSWNHVDGDHEIRVEIDPENKIAEPNDQVTGINNNVKTRDVSVYPGPSVNQRDIILLAAIVVTISLFIIIFAIMVIIMIFKRFRAKKKG